MSIFINRTINMKRIKAIGLDMDYTIVKYHSENFEEFTFYQVMKKLVKIKNYPKEILKAKFDYKQVIQGLIIDKRRGNVLHVSRFGKVKKSCHGKEFLDFNKQQKIYSNQVIDLGDPSIQSLDTSFAVSNGVAFIELVEFKKHGMDLPDYDEISDDIKEVLDLAHSDGTLKGEVRNNIEKYIVQDPMVPKVLQKYKDAGKKILVVTNSDYSYTKLLLDYTINPFLENNTTWEDLFEVTITLSCKPSFFTSPSGFLAVDPQTGFMTNFEGKIEKGIYQGGFAGKLQKDLGLNGEEILYIGDHIYGDVVTLKKTFNWRTALVLEPLKEEIRSLNLSTPNQLEIDKLMIEKELLEEKLLESESSEIFKEIEIINERISHEIDEYNSHFNPYWGEMMRAGLEESRFADQVQKYACIYMTEITDLFKYSPKKYLRPMKRSLPHEPLRK